MTAWNLHDLSVNDELIQNNWSVYLKISKRFFQDHFRSKYEKYSGIMIARYRRFYLQAHYRWMVFWIGWKAG